MYPDDVFYGIVGSISKREDSFNRHTRYEHRTNMHSRASDVKIGLLYAF